MDHVIKTLTSIHHFKPKLNEINKNCACVGKAQVLFGDNVVGAAVAAPPIRAPGSCPCCCSRSEQRLTFLQKLGGLLFSRDFNKRFF